MVDESARGVPVEKKLNEPESNKEIETKRKEKKTLKLK